MHVPRNCFLQSYKRRFEFLRLIVLKSLAAWFFLGFNGFRQREFPAIQHCGVQRRWLPYVNSLRISMADVLHALSSLVERAFREVARRKANARASPHGTQQQHSFLSSFQSPSSSSVSRNKPFTTHHTSPKVILPSPSSHRHPAKALHPHISKPPPFHNQIACHTAATLIRSSLLGLKQYSTPTFGMLPKGVRCSFAAALHSSN